MRGFLSPAEASNIWLPSVLHPFRRSDVIAGYLTDFGVATIPGKVAICGISTRIALYTRAGLGVMASQYERFEQGGSHPEWLPPEGPYQNPLETPLPTELLEIIPQGEPING